MPQKVEAPGNGGLLFVGVRGRTFTGRQVAAWQSVRYLLFMYRILAVSLLLLCGPLAAEPANPANPPSRGDAFYSRFVIVEPLNGATLRDNGGNVTVRVEITPGLNRNVRHRLRILLDGKSRSPVFEKSGAVIENVDRGSHELIAVIVDRHEVELMRSAPVTFYLHRRSLLHPNRQPAGDVQKSTER